MSPRGSSRNPFINYYLKVARRMRGKPVTVIAKAAGARWRAMSITQRLDYYDACGASSNWGASLPASRNYCSSGLSGKAPSVSRSPFINFFVQMYREVGRDYPVTVIARAAGKKWTCMSVPERRPFYEAACRFGRGSHGRSRRGGSMRSDMRRALRRRG